MDSQEKREKLFELSKQGLISDEDLAFELNSIRSESKKSEIGNKYQEQAKANKQAVKKIIIAKDLEFKRDVVSKMTNKFGEPAYTEDEISNMSEEELNSIYYVLMQSNSDIIENEKEKPETVEEEAVEEKEEEVKEDKPLTTNERKDAIIKNLTSFGTEEQPEQQPEEQSEEKITDAEALNILNNVSEEEQEIEEKPRRRVVSMIKAAVAAIAAKLSVKGSNQNRRALENIDEYNNEQQSVVEQPYEDNKITDEEALSVIQPSQESVIDVPEQNERITDEEALSVIQPPQEPVIDVPEQGPIRK